MRKSQVRYVPRFGGHSSRFSTIIIITIFFNINKFRYWRGKFFARKNFFLYRRGEKIVSFTINNNKYVHVSECVCAFNIRRMRRNQVAACQDNKTKIKVNSVPLELCINQKLRFTHLKNKNAPLVFNPKV